MLKYLEAVKNLKLNDSFVKDKFSVGIDIGTASVKAVKLKLLKEGVELCGFSLEPVQADLEPVLKSIIDKQDAGRINISVSGQNAILRYINFPKMNADELKQSMKFEAQKNIPFSVQEVNLDAAVLKPDMPEGKMLVLLAAVKKDILAQRLKLFDGLGASVSVIDVDSVALINAFNYNYGGEDGLKGKAVALLNVGASFTNLNILEEGIPRLSRDIPIAGNTFTQKFSETFGIAFKAAESLKLGSEQGKKEAMATAAEAVVAGLAGEVRTSFDYYESQSTYSVGKIFLSGAGSRLPGFRDMLNTVLGIEVEPWDPLRKVSISPELDDQQKIREISGQFAVAVGVALHQ